MWLFGITNLPFGIATGYAAIAVPALLREAGIEVGRIAGIEALLLLPLAWQFLYGPIVDLRLRRRSWLLLTATLGSALLSASLILPLPSALGPFVFCCFLGQALCSLVNSCNGGLIAVTVAAQHRGQAGGWLYAAAMAGNVVGGGLVLELCQYNRPLAAAALLVLSVLPALAVLWIREPAAAAGFARLHETLRDTWTTLRSRIGWSGMLFSLSPIGSAALVNLFAGLGPDFRASPHAVAFINAYWGGLGPAAGSLLAGRFLDRVDKRTAFVASGLLTAAVDVGMALCPQTPLVYALGVGIYLLTIGISYAAFCAVVLEVIGVAEHSAATQFTLYTAAGNVASSYAVWLDGWGYDYFAHHGQAPIVGMLGADAALNIVGAVILVGFFIPGRRRTLATPAP